MARSKAPTSRGDLEQMDKAELEKLAAKSNLAVGRTDGEDGEPRKEDYVAALAGSLGLANIGPTKSVRLTQKVYFEDAYYGPGAEEDDYMVDVPEDYPETREPKTKAK